MFLREVVAKENNRVTQIDYPKVVEVVSSLEEAEEESLSIDNVEIIMQEFLSFAQILASKKRPAMLSVTLDGNSGEKGTVKIDGYVVSTLGSRQERVHYDVIFELFFTE